VEVVNLAFRSADAEQFPCGELSMQPLDLPENLREFLAAGKQLDYDPNEYDAGAIKLLPLDRLTLQMFPMYTDSADMTAENLNADDPRRGENGYYLVDGVNLVSECNDYEPSGLLMRLPRERCFGTWDSDHWHISVFRSDQGWSQIAADPATYLNSAWGDLVQESPPLRPLIPWPKYRYSPQMGSGPYPYTPWESDR
jgi:hypothetical protein